MKLAWLEGEGPAEEVEEVEEEEEERVADGGGSGTSRRARCSAIPSASQAKCGRTEESLEREEGVGEEGVGEEWNEWDSDVSE